MYYPFQSKK